MNKGVGGIIQYQGTFNQNHFAPYYDYLLQQAAKSSSPVDLRSYSCINPVSQTIVPKKAEVPMLTNILTDAKKFVVEHKSTVYCVAVMLLIDHLVFNGSFRTRLQSIMSKLIDKVEKKLDGKPEAKNE